jgi:hypothetical protein
MKKSYLLALLTVLLFTIGCSNYGKEKTFKGVQLFYTTQVKEAEADSLGAFLISSHFTDGDPKTIQLNKTGSTYEFRMVIKKGIDQDPEYVKMAKAYAAEISSHVFNNAQVDVHFCDEKLKTIRVMPIE